MASNRPTTEFGSHLMHREHGVCHPEEEFSQFVTRSAILVQRGALVA